MTDNTTEPRRFEVEAVPAKGYELEIAGVPANPFVSDAENEAVAAAAVCLQEHLNLDPEEEIILAVKESSDGPVFEYRGKVRVLAHDTASITPKVPEWYAEEQRQAQARLEELRTANRAEWTERLAADDAEDGEPIVHPASGFEAYIGARLAAEYASSDDPDTELPN